MNVVRGEKPGLRTQHSFFGRGRRPARDAALVAQFSRSNNTGLPSIVHGARSGPSNKTPVRLSNTTTTSRSNSRTATTSDHGQVTITSTSGGHKRLPRSYRSSSTSTGAPLHTSSDNSRTPNSASSYTTDSTDSFCIIALSEGRGQARGEVGIAAIDARRPHLTLCQISDSQSYVNTLTKINVFNPIEILIPNTFCEGQQPSKLFSTIRDLYPTVTLTTVQRRHFSDSRGLQQIQHLCAPEYSSVEMLVLHKFYALSSASALLKYVEFIQNVIFAPKSLKVEYQGSQNTTVIDVDSSHRLELVRSLRGTGVQHSLLGILNHCNTGGGARLLRANILQPPCLSATIMSRQDCVQEMVDDSALFRSLETILSKFINVEQLLSLCMHVPQQDTARAAETQLNYTLLLKTTLELLSPLTEALQDAKAGFFVAVRQNLENEQYKKILLRIQETVHDDARMVKGFSASHMQRSFLVKPNISGLLDVARKTYCEIVEDITTLVTDLSQKHSLPIRLHFSASRGFHIQLVNVKNKFKEADLPVIFIQIQRSRSTLTFTTQDLVHIDQRAKDALNEIQMLSNVVVYTLLTDIREHIGCLYKLCENIAELDMLISLTHTSSMNNYVRPQFGDKLDVKKSRHPMLDFISPTEPEPNDIFASRYSNCHIITGPNMSGKSIYIRQIALLQIMAQIGCFVPAESAAFRIADHIFTRIGFDDSIECNASTFVLELRELQYIKQTITPNSLVIVDELCRGTSSEEGTAIAYALCEDLLQTDAFIFLTTHFLFLTKLQDLYCNVNNIHFEVVEELTEQGRSRLRYTHHLMPGITKVENYGLRLAEASAMPDSVVEHAKELVRIVSGNRKAVAPSVASNSTERSSYQTMVSILEVFEHGDLTLEKCRCLNGNRAMDIQESAVDEAMEIDETPDRHEEVEAEQAISATNPLNYIASTPAVAVPHRQAFSI